MGNCCRAQGAGALCSVTAWRGGIGSGQLKREGTHVYLRLTHISCMAEANTTLLSNYLQLKKKKQQTVFLSQSLLVRHMRVKYLIIGWFWLKVSHEVITQPGFSGISRLPWGYRNCFCDYCSGCWFYWLLFLTGSWLEVSAPCQWAAHIMADGFPGKEGGRGRKHTCKGACQNRNHGLFYNLISSVIYHLPVSSARCCWSCRLTLVSMQKGCTRASISVGKDH